MTTKILNLKDTLVPVEEIQSISSINVVPLQFKYLSTERNVDQEECVFMFKINLKGGDSFEWKSNVFNRNILSDRFKAFDYITEKRRSIIESVWPDKEEILFLC